MKIAADIRTVVDHFRSEASVLASQLAAATGEAQTVARAMGAYAAKEWDRFLHGTPVGQAVNFELRVGHGMAAEVGGLLKDDWTYGPLRAMVDPQDWLKDWKSLLGGMAPLVGLGGDGARGVGESWKDVGKQLTHWDEWSTDPGDALGRTTVDVATLFVPDGGEAAATGSKATEVRAAPKPAEPNSAPLDCPALASPTESRAPVERPAEAVHPAAVPAEVPAARPPSTGGTEAPPPHLRTAPMSAPIPQLPNSAVPHSIPGPPAATPHDSHGPGAAEREHQGSSIKPEDHPADIRPDEIPPLLVRDIPYETGGIHPDFVGEQYPGGPVPGPGVTYPDDTGRTEYRITIRDGLVYDSDGLLLDTSNGVSAFGSSSSGRAIFVMDKHGNFYASTYQRLGYFHHSSFFSGGEVAAARELIVKDGRIELLTDRSDHYTPGRSRTRQMLDQLAGQGIVIDPKNIHYWASPGT